MTELENANQKLAEQSRCWSRDLEELQRLRAAIRTAVNDFENVSWGWDGDCGSGRIIEKLEDAISLENSQAQSPEG